MLTPASFPSLEQFDATFRTDDRLQFSDEQRLIIEDRFPWEPPSDVGGRDLVIVRGTFVSTPDTDGDGDADPIIIR